MVSFISYIIPRNLHTIKIRALKARIDIVVPITDSQVTSVMDLLTGHNPVTVLADGECVMDLLQSVTSHRDNVIVTGVVIEALNLIQVGTDNSRDSVSGGVLTTILVIFDLGHGSGTMVGVVVDGARHSNLDNLSVDAEHFVVPLGKFLFGKHIGDIIVTVVLLQHCLVDGCSWLEFITNLFVEIVQMRNIILLLVFCGELGFDLIDQRA